MRAAPRILTREQALARKARKARWAAAVYFFSGVVLPPAPGVRFQTSSDSKATIFVCHQLGHRS